MSPLMGLVLAGGQSRRMGQDKATLEQDGQTLLARAVQILNTVCETTFVSVRTRQSDGERGRYAQIEDAHGGQGPADGIVSALAHDPASAWLVVACDLPRLSIGTIEHLVARRDPGYQATAYASTDNGLPEPLCAIYEPSALAPMQAFLNDEVRCPRKMLLNMRTQLLPPAAHDALANANTPEDWARLTTSA